MHPSRNDSVPADTSSRSSPSVRVPHWGGFFRYRGLPLTLCRLCAATSSPGRTADLSGSVKPPVACLSWSIDFLAALPISVGGETPQINVWRGRSAVPSLLQNNCD
ncbi:hypothetical protein CesoFtcFv8_018606 [Champsocephalus esox]|uniref:Uncharacterized protein n=2 Tax=Champsocephalus TaxID=52236 RepID=A0AAN8HFY4_CHAGU|nr:hypothetical protein CesoFtcFv8_018606 [Champsocephalus esox]KAK5913897.1 hypothetical protein CgunFtcFv8_008381 [Champsocephalus gunnari]